MSTTALTIVESTLPKELHPLCQQYPGLILPADCSLEEIDNFAVMVTAYTGSVTEQVEGYLSSIHPRTKQVTHNPLCVTGAVCYVKEMTDQTTGEIIEKIGTVFKVELSEIEETTYISFTSTAALNFVKRSLLPIRSMGDWDRPLWIEIYKKSLSVGHTYTFKVVASPK